MADKTDGRNDLNVMSDGRMVWTIFGETDGRNGMNEMSDSRMARQYSAGQMVRMV